MCPDDGIAIVGLGSLLPDALDPGLLWRNILDRHCALRPVPQEIWDPSEFYGEESDGEPRTSSRLGGVVRGWQFSARDFGIPPSVESSLDITQKAALVAARAAVAGAGIHGPTDGANCAVIIGNSLGGMQIRSEHLMLIMHRLIERTIEDLPSIRVLPQAGRAGILAELRANWCSQFNAITGNSLPGVLGNLIAARIAHYYNFRGPTQTVDAACASSLAALECAVSGLKAGRYDLAVAGGVDFSMDPVAYIGFSKMHALSDSGSFPFDERASGFVMGEGAVLFALKRLEDARRANDHIFAVIEGFGFSSDGRGSALIAPSVKGQRLALRRAYAQACIAPDRFAYVEAHGTATQVGDPVEILALRDVYRECRPGSIALGSIKANVGHLKGAAGAAGVLRAVLAADAGVIPPQANFERPNPRCKIERSPFRIPVEPQEWPADRVHVAVSSFGFGGVNYHCVLRRNEGGGRAAGRARHVPPAPSPSACDHGVLGLGAASADELLEAARRLHTRASQAQSLQAVLEDCSEPQFAAHRLALYASDVDSAAQALALAVRGMSGEASPAALQSAGIYWRVGAPARGDSLALMFPGQGSQYLGMLHEMRAAFPVIDRTLREADDVLAGEFEQPLSAYIAPMADASVEEEKARFAALTRTEVLQPALVACNEALRRLLVQFCAPTTVFGHSLGEISACIAAGVMSYENGLRLAAARGKVLSEIAGSEGGPGGLLQVAASEQTLTQALGGWPDGLTVANRNCTRQTVIGGAVAALQAVETRLRAAGVACSLLPVSAAFHTPRMAGAVAPLRAHLEQMELFVPRMRLISSVTGKAVPAMQEPREVFAELLSRQVAEPVEFTETLRSAYESGARTFIEVGPKAVLCGFVGDVLRSLDPALACCHPKAGERQSFGRVLAALVAEGRCPLRAHSVQTLRTAPVSPRLPRVRGLSRPTPPQELREWALARIAQWLEDPELDLRLDAALEADLGIDALRQREWLARLAEEAGRTVSLPPPHRGFKDLRALLEALEADPGGAGEVTALRATPPPCRLSDTGRGADDTGRTAAPGVIERRTPKMQSPAPTVAREAPKSRALEEQILELLAQRTGYARSEFDLDADLEKVLGIDSLAQLEIVAELQDTLRLPPDDTFRVANYPTLRKLIGYVQGKMAGAPARPATVADVAPDGALAPPYFCRQRSWEATAPGWSESAARRMLVLHDGSGERLRAAVGGLSVSLADGMSQSGVAERLGRDVDVLVLIVEAPEENEDSPARAAIRAAACVFDLGRGILGAGAPALPVILVVGASQRHETARAWTGAWVAGWKSLCREWQARQGDLGGQALRILEIAGSLDAHVETVREAVAGVGPRELRLGQEGKWKMPVLKRLTMTARADADPTQVAVLTGGARGITSCLARALFEATGCRLVLVGRTSPGEGAEAFDPIAAREKARESLGGDASHAQLHAKVEEQRRRVEAGETIRRLRAAGAEVHYIQADVTERGALSRVLDDVRSRFGRTDWVIHGAGIDHSHAVRAASELSEAVLRTKLTVLDPATLASAPEAKWVGLSSISAVYGNAGQLEYSAANEAMARVILERGGLVLDFGPWRDLGMAARLHGLLKGRGIDALEAGAAARSATALIASEAVGEFVLAGRMGREAGGLAGRPLSVLLDVPEAEFAASLTLEHDKAAWLRDHSWRSASVLPAVVSLSVMIEAARRLEPAASVSAIRDCSLEAPIMVRPGGSEQVTVEAERVTADSGGLGLVVATRIRHAGKPVHSALVELGQAGRTDVPWEVSWPAGARLISREALYAKLFHGPSFQVLESVECEAGRAVGCSVPLGQTLGIDLPQESRWIALAREAALQTIGAHLLFEHSIKALPEGFRRCEVHAAAAAGERVRILARQMESSDTPLFDARILGEGGRLLEWMEGVRFRRVAASRLEEVA